MKTLKTTALMAILSLAGGIALAQPAETTQTPVGGPGAPGPGGPGGPGGPRGDRRGAMMGEHQGEEMGPYQKLMHAMKLETLSQEQKDKLQAILDERKAEAQALREEMRTAMESARQAVDREARQKIMEPLRQKHAAVQQQIDAALTSILTSEQMTELNQKSKEMMEKGRERFGRRGEDGMTTGAKRGDGDKMGKRGDKGGKRGKKGDKAPGADTDAATTGTQSVNPFSE